MIQKLEAFVSQIRVYIYKFQLCVVTFEVQRAVYDSSLIHCKYANLSEFLFPSFVYEREKCMLFVCYSPSSHENNHQLFSRESFTGGFNDVFTQLCIQLCVPPQFGLAFWSDLLYNQQLRRSRNCGFERVHPGGYFFRSVSPFKRNNDFNHTYLK